MPLSFFLLVSQPEEPQSALPCVPQKECQAYTELASSQFKMLLSAMLRTVSQ